LTIEEYRQVVADLVAMGVRVFDISGGEPMLYPHLIELCEAIRSHDGTRIWLVSNGTMTKPAVLERLSRLVERYVISLDSPEPTWHDEFRGLKGAFSKSLETLRKARSLPFPEIGVNQLICPANIHTVVPMLELCRSAHIDRLALLSHRDVSENGVMLELIPSLADLQNVWATVAKELGGSVYPRFVELVVPSFLYPESIECRRKFSREIRNRVTMHYPHLRGLSAYRATIVVKPFGVLSGDTAMVNSDFFDVGSVRDGVRNVWEKGALDWRTRLAEREKRLRETAPCGQCPRWGVCHGGCPAAALHQWGPDWSYDRSCDRFRADGCF
jgi:radical SAM protein with 4Fe4S-binding SPASM domain